LWVPFEVGYAYDNKGEKMKVLRHKNISKSDLPEYIKVKYMINLFFSLNTFLDSIRKRHFIYENLIKKGEDIKAFSSSSTNPLNIYLDNE
jgi:hypothetical protein